MRQCPGSYDTVMLLCFQVQMAPTVCGMQDGGGGEVGREGEGERTGVPVRAGAPPCSMRFQRFPSLAGFIWALCDAGDVVPLLLMLSSHLQSTFQ